MKLLRHVANLGYGSRREVKALFREGRITDAAGRPLDEDARVPHAEVRLDGEPLDPAPGVVLMMHKPVGTTCSTRDAGRLVYGLLPPRFRLRTPALSSVGRLDRDTSGLLLFTDDGTLLHRIISPRAHVPKVYEATLAEDLRGDEGALFASGTLVLESEDSPLAPAGLEVLGPRRARLTVTEGRYHQVRRMFAATGNRVVTLHRSAVGALPLDPALGPGEWRVLAPEEIARVFA
ncbi:16S rRNA pseudouridine(516) synthase [Coralloluteibacterium thermophilus]|uniref:Pseudouridine synthase n=1 Tax=Coralloluteibacterium thermophilum TaxID=2707049 RepID=A0ABV9NPP7_9GAMM